MLVFIGKLLTFSLFDIIGFAWRLLIGICLVPLLDISLSCVISFAWSLYHLLLVLLAARISEGPLFLAVVVFLMALKLLNLRDLLHLRLLAPLRHHDRLLLNLEWLRQIPAHAAHDSTAALMIVLTIRVELVIWICRIICCHLLISIWWLMLQWLRLLKSRLHFLILIIKLVRVLSTILVKGLLLVEGKRL